MKQLPISLWRFFWDTDASKIDAEKNAHYVIARLMDYGHTKDIVWMKGEYGEQMIKDVLRNNRGISAKSANYWSKILGLSEKEVPCLNKPYQRIPYGV
jgi:hypothetical protein